MRSRPQIATKAERLATIRPTTSTAQPCASRPACLSSWSSLKPASAIAGSPSRKESRRQGRARARHAGDQRPDLGDPDPEAVEETNSVEGALMPRRQFRETEQHCHDQARRTDHPELAERRAASVQGLGERETGSADRYRGDDDAKGETQRRVGEIAPGECGQRAVEDVPDVVPKIGDNRGECRELHRRRKRRARILPAEQRRHDAHMRGRGDRHQLGNALHDPENGHLRIAECDKSGVDAAGAGARH